MKRSSQLFYLVLAVAVVLSALGFWRPPFQVTAQAPNSSENTCAGNRSIQVSGTAVVYVTPDRAMIQLGVQTNGSTPDGVHSANSQEIVRVINAIKALGLESKDIATDYMIVYPVYDDYNSLAIKGYRVDNTISITLREVSRADDVIIAALRAGANEVQDVQFYTSELRKYRDQARDLAMKAASEKAQAMAAAAGASTGCLLTASENTWSHYYGSWRGGRTMSLWTQNTVQNSSPSEAAPLNDSPISLGQIAVEAQISASYSLK
jgi:uncharacterized protein YggE